MVVIQIRFQDETKYATRQFVVVPVAILCIVLRRIFPDSVLGKTGTTSAVLNAATGATGRRTICTDLGGPSGSGPPTQPPSLNHQSKKSSAL